MARQVKHSVTYHRPCSVQLLLGPTEGRVSQNCVSKSWPPGYTKQQSSSPAVVLWQLKGPSVGQLGARLKGGAILGIEADSELRRKGVCERKLAVPNEEIILRSDGILQKVRYTI